MDPNDHEQAGGEKAAILIFIADVDIGSILGWGFPAYTGGTLSFIDTVGIRPFVEQCDRLAELYGERFEVPPALRERAAAGRSFHAPAGEGY